MVGYSDLANWMQTNYALSKYHDFDMDIVWQWIPYERDIYIEMIHKSIEEEKHRHDNANR